MIEKLEGALNIPLAYCNKVRLLACRLYQAGVEFIDRPFREMTENPGRTPNGDITRHPLVIDRPQAKSVAARIEYDAGVEIQKKTRLVFGNEGKLHAVYLRNGTAKLIDKAPEIKSLPPAGPAGGANIRPARGEAQGNLYLWILIFHSSLQDKVMQLIDGKAVAAHFKARIAEEVTQLKAESGKTPHLVAILVGNNGASETYVAHKVKACAELGFESTLVRFPDTVSEEELFRKVEEINANPDMDGLIVQLPLPKHINPDRIMETIAPAKDVDGFHPINIGRMAKGLPAYVSATPQGCLMLLEHYGIETAGKHCVVVGRSQIVGLPMSILMQRNTYPGNCTVTITHSKTANLAEICRQADILVGALGRPEFITADMVKEGAVVLDVGLERVADPSKKSGFSLKGDVKFDEVAPKTSYITPVPGGVGQMTIISLMQNTLLAAKGAIYAK